MADRDPDSHHHPALSAFLRGFSTDIGVSAVRPELVEGPSFLLNGFMSFWVYMLHCYGGAFYVGHTDDIERRINQHQSGEIAGFTQHRRPLKLVWSEQFSTRIEALEMERRLKGWSRAKKMALIRSDWETIARLAQDQKNSPSTSSGRMDG
ncbi:GIY-YIG nuclease family protein [Sphingobium sp. B11D3D]|uniref:GIY-YIG nuclease family protein n=1 Tax=Sphingobium sp. B11D3D TaxID=2940576 RepID=UPI002224F01D|nr:GIY-YIG nuclease family protein [Sphingobium sp. B11D3D]MCW2368322.1 putative endonuclease [Sphingobium sp. B11D3D]